MYSAFFIASTTRSASMARRSRVEDDVANSEHNHGHYGLAAQYYTHFTSPIRRYPDLLVHRMIREYTNNMSQETREHFEEVIPELATSSSTLERRAIDAERVVEAMKKAEYMEEFVGQEFDGIVGSVVKFGMFVELPNTIEGLVHITTLPEFYNYNERTMTRSASMARRSRVEDDVANSGITSSKCSRVS